MVNYDLHRSRSRSDTVSQLLAQLAEVSRSSPGPDVDASPGPSAGVGSRVDSTGATVGSGAGGGAGWADRPMGLLRGIHGGGDRGSNGGKGQSQGQKMNQDQEQVQGQGQGKGVEGTTASPSAAVAPPSSSTTLSFDKVLPPKTLRRSARALYRYLSNTLSSKAGKGAATTTTAGGTRARVELSDPLLPDPITGIHT